LKNYKDRAASGIPTPFNYSEAFDILNKYVDISKETKDYFNKSKTNDPI